jgi:hypothetical protein
VRCGLNSQTTQIFGNVIDNFESAVAVDNATDALVIEGNVLETLMSTGYGVDMRGTSGSPTYRAVSIRKNHFEDVYGAIAGARTELRGRPTRATSTRATTSPATAGGTNYFLSDPGALWCRLGEQPRRIQRRSRATSPASSTSSMPTVPAA